MPIAQPDRTSTLRGVPVTMAVLANDEGSSLVIVGYTLPIHGMVVLNPDRTFTYTPAADFVGQDAFSYTVRDGVGGTAEGLVTITVTRPNLLPTPANDEIDTAAGAPVDIAVLANDNDPDGDDLVLLAIDAPGHGTVSVLPDRSIRYVPQAGFSGLDSFAYTVGDGMGGAATAQVLITVGVAARPPLTRDDAAVTAEGETVAIDVLANDNDPDGGPLALAGFTMPEHGTVSPTPDRKLAYTPEPGFSGTDRFAYVAQDAEGNRSTGHVAVTVTPTNAPPVAANDFARSSGEPITLDLLANDADPDGDPLKLAALSLPIEGGLSVRTDGRVTYNPAPGFIGTDRFSYQVSDGTDAVEAEVHVSVSAPTLPTFANGYANQHELRLPAWAAGAPTLDNFLLPVSERRSDLKSAANGGPVKSPAGWDIRFETAAGVKLGHVILSYNGADGTLVALVNMPRALAAAESIYLYTGKAGLAAPEEDPVAARAGNWLAWYAGHQGIDRTGQGRDLVPAGPLAGTIGYWPAASFDGVDDKFTQASSAWLNGLPALTVVSLHRASAKGVKYEAFNVAAGTAAELGLHYSNTSDSLTMVAKFGATSFLYKSALGTQSTLPQAVAGVVEAGRSIRMAIDGRTDTPSQATAALSGTLTVSDTLEWGAGGRGDLQFWKGELAFLGFCADPLPAAATEALTAAMIDPRLVYGMGAANAVTTTNRSPVALPLKNQTANAGIAKNYTVTGAAWDPNGDTLTVTDAVLVAGSGTVSVPNTTQVRFVPAAGVSGPFVIEFGLRDPAGLASRGRIYGTVAAAAEPDLFLNPFNKWSAHHRPIGAGVKYGIPPSVARGNEGSTNPTHYDAGRLNERGRLGTLPITLDLEDSKVGTKYYWRCVAGRMTTKPIALYNGSTLRETVNVNCPTPGTAAYYPIVSSNQDFQVLFYKKDAGTDDVLLTIRGFDYADNRGVFPIKEWRLAGMDAYESATDGESGTSASRMRWPMGFLRGHEVNDANLTDPICHALQASVARQFTAATATTPASGAPPATQIVGRRSCWPAYGQDSSAGSDPNDNNGDIPYGALLTLKPEDYNAIVAALPAANRRGRRVIDAIYFYGIYVVDGNGSPNSIQLRVDAEVGWTPDPTATTDSPDTRPGCRRVPGVKTDIESALALAASKLWPVFNPQTYGGDRQVWSDGLPYVGGGGPRDGKPLATTGSRNTAYDV